MVLRHTKWGQHFIISQELIDRLLEFASINRRERIFEIGTGDGRLTRSIAQRCSYVLSYELDKLLFNTACNNMKGYTNLKIINGDALKADADDFDCVVSSLPYYLSGKFIEWFARQKVPRAVLIIQKDFFDKLAANVGERKYGPHSVIAQYCFRLTKGDLVPNGMFTPPPRVTSVIVRFDRKVRLEKARDISVGLKMLFSFRGKTIRATEKLLKKSSQGALPEFPNKNMRVEELDPNQAILAATMIRGVVD